MSSEIESEVLKKRKTLEKNIHERLFEVSKKVEQIEKKGYNNHSNYSYIRAVDVVKGVKKLLLENGVCLTINEESIIRKEINKNIHCEIKSRATFYCVNDPSDKKEIVYYSASSDRLDKDIFKAKTNGLKYMFIQEFLIETEDGLQDVENDGPRKSNKLPPLPQKKSNNYKKTNTFPTKPGTQKIDFPGVKKKLSIKQFNYIVYLQSELGLTEDGYQIEELMELTPENASSIIEHYKKQAGL